jgi:hypothetical protein
VHDFGERADVFAGSLGACQDLKPVQSNSPASTFRVAGRGD